MKHIVTIICLSVLFISCKKEEKPSVAPPNTAETKAITPEKKSPSPSPKDTPVLKKTPSITINAEGGSNEGVATILLILEDESITGSLKLNTISLELKGILDDKTIRCWLSGEDSDGAIWKGNLIGTMEQNVYKGTFTMTNNAGEKVISGTWSSKER